MLNRAQTIAQQVAARIRGARHGGLGANPVRVAQRGWRDGWRALRPLLSRSLTAGLAWRVAWARRLAPADPLPPFQGRAARIGHIVTALAASGFALFFCVFLFAQHDAYLTHAEDMGIMTQALWNTMHGAPLHQTICDPVGDTNCLGDVSRLAIHFEPIMFLLAPIYALAPSPKTLQLAQALVVAAGAFPAYWMASRRLRSAAAGVLCAVLYLLYPPLDAALTFDFHAVTLAAPLLMFALYFLLTRNSPGFLIACALAIGTKEEVALTILMLGLYAALVQGRRRLGGGVALFALGWVVVEVLVMRAASPIGHSPMTSRYAAFGASPAAILVGVLTHPLHVGQYLLDPGRVGYLGALLGPLAFVGLASPLTLLLAAPVIALNMLSNQSVMYSGLAQYSAELAPVMLVAAIDGAGKLASFLSWLGAWLATWLRTRLPRALRHVRTRLRGLAWRLQAQSVFLSLAVGMALAGAQSLAERWTTYWSTCWAAHRDRGYRARRRSLRVASAGQLALLGIVLVAVIAELGVQQRAGYLPFGRTFVWPQSSAHIRLADTLVARIPPDASVTAQSDLAPHLSNRREVYLFPDEALESDYDLLDVEGNIFPFDDLEQYVTQVRAVLSSGVYQLDAAQDGYLLLQRAATSGAQSMTGAAGTLVDPAHLPASFYSFAQTTPATIAHRLHGVTLKDGAGIIQLLGYDLSPSPNLYLNSPTLIVTTYWRVTGRLDQAVVPELEVDYPSGYAATFTSFPTTDWLPVAAWPQGATMVVRSEPLSLLRQEPGAIQIGVRLRTVDGQGALRARTIRAFTPWNLRVQALPRSGARVPATHVVISENGTLITFAQERVTP